jgi:uncharacterized protein (TIGR02300 family)
MTSAKKKSSKSAAKAPARKAASAKAAPAPRKKPAKPAARREPAPAPEPEPREPRRAPPRAKSPAAPAAPAPEPRAARSRLGEKWICFRCEAKFYDLNKPQPLCPKCGANQHDRPKREPKPKPTVEMAVARELEPDRDVLPLDEEEDEAILMDDEEIDLGTPELEGDAEEFVEEEEEEPGDA